MVEALEPIQLLKPIKLKKSTTKIENILTATAALEAGILTTIFAGPFAGAKAAALTGTGLGLVKSSPKARGLIKEVPSQVGRTLTGQKGQSLGRFIEEPKSALPKSPSEFKEKVADITKKAGLIAGGTAAVLGGAGLVKGAISKAKEKAKSITNNIPSMGKPSASIITGGGAVTPASAPVVPQFSQIPGEVKPKQEIPKQVSAPAQKPIKVSQNVEVKVNAGNKRFLNKTLVLNVNGKRNSKTKKRKTKKR